MVKQRPLDFIEGFYLAQIAYHLHHQGLFERLSPGRTVSALAKEFGYDEQLLGALLEFLYQASDLLRRRNRQVYSLRPKYRNYYFLGFQLEKFIGAYGPAALRLEQSLSSRNLGRSLVDRKIEAHAYSVIESPPNPIVMSLVPKLKLKSILDLGCGPATMLTELCSSNRSFRAWGIDESESMCRVANERIARAGLEKRVRIVHGDARKIERHLSPGICRDIDSLQCKGLFNELFRRGNSEIIQYLKKLKKYFPGKFLFVVDYYAKLTHLQNVPRRYQHTLIHDLIQFFSAQGVPPANLKGWVDLYRSAECFVEHAYEGDDQGIEWFVHLVRL